jgi:deazaflavin-dependent oxidoreductase (nitroreductase family)
MKLQRLYNPIVAGILRSPLHGVLSKSVMLITYAGCKSGKEYTTPVSYVRHDGELLIVASREHAWWRNLRGDAPVRVCVRERNAKGEATAFEGESAEEGLLDVLRAVPAYRKHWGVDLDEGGRPKDPAALARISRENALVRLSDLTEAESR